jgi:aldose 1-epimerase
MARFTFTEKKFGRFDTFILTDEKTGVKTEIALQGATLLNYFTNLNNQSFNIIDGFVSPEELEASRGARSYIMAPFANRIQKGEYIFEGELFKLQPIPPRKEVIHGFTSFEKFEIKNVTAQNNFISVDLFTDKIRPGKNPGYPFFINLNASFKLEENKLTVKITAVNAGKEPAPFGTGWHPYFRTSENGIDNLILTIEADGIIMLDDKNIPLPGKSAYHNLKDFPNLDFRSSLPEEKRIIGNRILDHCYFNLKKDSDDYSVSSIYDPIKKVKIELFQQGGVTLAFSGDTLSARQRKSIALEPMQFITNAFNREELIDKVKIMPGEKSEFIFGIRVTNN